VDNVKRLTAQLCDQMAEGRKLDAAIEAKLEVLGMAGQWRDATLGAVIELKRGYDLPASERRRGPPFWAVRENVRAQLRVLVKRILRKHGYPPDKQEKATRTVLEQAELLSETWAIA
jgi:Domain of unknown function (DUF3387)